MNYNDFERKIKSKVGTLYYLYGGEKTFIEESLKSLKKRVVEGRSHDLLEFEKGVVGEIISAARTVSPFGGRRLIIVNNPSSSLWTDLGVYLESPKDNACLVFVSTKCEIPKKLEKNVILCNFSKVPENRLNPYIKGLFKSHNKTIAVKEISQIIGYLGNDLMEIENEVNKLVIYIGEKDYVDSDSIQTVLEKSRVGSIFELINYIGSDEKSKAIKLLGRLLDSGQGDFAVLVMIVRHLKQITDVKKLMGLGYTPKQIADRCKINVYFVRDALRRARKTSWDHIINLFELVKFTERALKYKKTSNKILLERLILEL
jgi:DNA polymerase-3 subunit delta